MSHSSRKTLPSYVAKPSSWISQFRVSIELRQEAKKSDDSFDEFKKLEQQINAASRKLLNDVGLGEKGGRYNALLAEEKLEKLGNKSMESERKKELEQMRLEFELLSFRTYTDVIESFYARAKSTKDMLGKTLQDIYSNYSHLLTENHKKIAIIPFDKEFVFVEKLPVFEFKPILQQKSASLVESKSEVKAESALQDPIVWLKSRIAKIQEKYTQTISLEKENKEAKSVAENFSSMLKLKENEMAPKYVHAPTFKNRDIFYLINMEKQSNADLAENKKYLDSDNENRIKSAQRRQASLEMHLGSITGVIEGRKNVLLALVQSLEQAYQVSYDSMAKQAVFGAFFSGKVNTPVSYIDLLNSKEKEYTMERMVAVTLHDIYQNYSNLLPENHKKKYVDGIVSLPSYEFQSPSGRASVEAAPAVSRKSGFG